MRFRTEITISRSTFTIDHSRRGFMAGSCFSENIYGKLSAAKFPVTSNPSGILFNPISIAAMLRRIAVGRKYVEPELSFSGGLWFSYDHHGSFSRASAAEALAAVNAGLEAGKEALAAAGYVIITFGTSWIYRLAGDGRVVANCHKQPAGHFVRERLTAEDIISEYRELLSGPLSGRQVLFTVSPVRHLNDGFEENSLSKAILRTAAAVLADENPDVFYFPSFEIMNDDLRDYRFYAEDMAHPSRQATDYIWDKFTGFSMDAGTKALLPRLAKLRAAVEHRMMNNSNGQADAFRAGSLKLIDELQTELPSVDFTAERNYFTL